MLYLQGQRWGSALPAPPATAAGAGRARAPTVVEVAGDAFDSAPPPLVPPPDDADGGRRLDYVADDEAGLYLAGDFVSSRPPGVEAAVLSGLDVAEHIARVLGARRAAVA